jgi:hypothetical protein
MAAGVVDIVFVPTLVARQQVSASGLSPTVDQIVPGATMAGQETLTAACPIVWSIAPEDVCHLWHRRAPTRSEIGHEGIDGGVHDVQGRCRQLRIAGGGTRALVAQPFLNAPQ